MFIKMIFIKIFVNAIFLLKLSSGQNYVANKTCEHFRDDLVDKSLDLHQMDIEVVSYVNFMKLMFTINSLCKQ